MHQNLPSQPRTSCALSPLGLIPLAPTISLYTLSRADLIHISPSLLGLILILGGATQVSAGLTARRLGNSCGAATLIPIGLFWLSLLGFYIFPELGLGKGPSAVAMTSYLTMWGIFAAIFYLGSFSQSRIIQLLFGSMMVCFLSLGLAEIRDNVVFLYSAAFCGTTCGLTALYAGLAQILNERLHRTVMPLGSWHGDLDDDYEQVSS
ncbi:MAG: hypothetical protein C0618_02565 [Desulfuromonas sp.]|nr:MAG: hypothetical protein C0618_02565 [Desulfuromonas sp.]